ncbi:MAG: DUF4838 domain-containing protein [Candidatus Aminicenantales bacterium]
MSGKRAATIVLAAFFLSPAGAAVLPAQTSAPRTLAEKGRALFSIVFPTEATENDRRAASILQDAFFRMTGVRLSITEKDAPGRMNEILIGFPKSRMPRSFRASLSRLKPDGFLITLGRNLYIVSGGGQGSIYGVVHILEKYFGCRRYSPAAVVFPKRDKLSLPPFFDLENPANEFRAVHGEFDRDPDYRDWNRLNLTDEAFAQGYYVHTFNTLVPWETYFADHPEYYAWMNGKRIKDQLCLSNPDVLRLAIEKLRTEMAAQPGKKLWSVSQNDNSSYCQCPACSKIIEEEGSPAGPIIRFVDAVAAAFPDKTISTLAYQYSRPAPKKTKPASNVQIMLCTIELNRGRPIADDPDSLSFLRDIVDWGKIAKNIFLWDYTVDFAHQVSPFPNLHVLQPNIQLFVRNGVHQHFQQTNTAPGHEFSELKGWLLARLLWNPDLDFEAALDDFLGGYYGGAAPWIRRYIASLQDALLKSGAKLDIYEPPNAHADDYLSAPNVDLYNRLFDNALAAVAGDPVFGGRVLTARLPLQYAMLEIGKNDMFGPRGFYKERAGRFTVRPGMTQLLNDFYSACLAGDVGTLNESGLTPKDYYDAGVRFIDVQTEGNLAFRKPVLADPPPAAKYGRGDLALLTNGVRGANDFKVHWLGWEGVDFRLDLDLGVPSAPKTIALGTLYDPKSWILHPRRVTCLVSSDGLRYQPIGTTELDDDQRREDATRTWTFTTALGNVRYVRFQVEATKRLPDWHSSAGGASWVFIDEIVVR